ncbi:MAG: hypothetical protein M1812_004063 [Candelaria pacifica]|nr:MAG: hypothetical protein M1812_004063 [Candelaria pacifica]
MSENRSKNRTDAAAKLAIKPEEAADPVDLKKSESDEETKPEKVVSSKTKPVGKANIDDSAAPVIPKTPTKRGTKKAASGETDDNKDSTLTSNPKSKRTPAKAKTDYATPSEENNEDTAISTPSKKKRGSMAVNDLDDDAETLSTPRKRRAPIKPQTPGRSIGTKLEDASEEDKMLISMKDSGKSWAEIRKAWKAKTGEDTGNSTLPNRYNRLKTNMATFKEEDEPKLLAAKAEIEKANELEFWGKVGVAMEAAGADKYPIKALEKRFKELQKKPAPAPANDAEDDEAGDNE